ncbi:YceH family protein [Verrucomicrobiales bacterium]|nr:YceH family protein [Verrucomicrobiales bacterium]
MNELTHEEARVLGCLLEKEMATPEYYPMTINSLLAACNQKTARNPVVAYDTPDVEVALEGLRDKRYTGLMHQSGARAAKHKHRIEDEFPDLGKPERAILALLLLRGQQSASEVRSRSERLCVIADNEAAETALQGLIDHQPEALVQRIPLGGGRHTVTYVHLLCGEPEIVENAAPAAVATAAAPSSSIREDIAGLRKELDELRQEFDAFRDSVGG